MIRGMLVHLQPLAAFGDMHLTFVRAKGTVRSFGSKIAPLLASGFRPREWMRRPCMIVVQPASAQPSGSWAGCQQQLIAQRDPAALARGWPALVRGSGRRAGSIPPGECCQPPLGAAYCRGSAGRGRAFWAGGSGQICPYRESAPVHSLAAALRHARIVP